MRSRDGEARLHLSCCLTTFQNPCVATQIILLILNKLSNTTPVCLIISYGGYGNIKWLYADYIFSSLENLKELEDKHITKHTYKYAHFKI